MTARPKLTVGMAHHTDAQGVYYTIQHIRQTQRRLSEIEFVVVDNSAGSTNPRSTSHSKHVQEFMAYVNAGTAGAKYVQMTEDEAYGTTQARDRVFKEATGEFVLCLDCHVLVEPLALDQLIEWHDKHPKGQDLIQGPILSDNMTVMASQFDDYWRDEMWGIWALDPEALIDGKWTDTKAITCSQQENLPIIDRTALTSSLNPFEIKAMGLGLFGCRKEAWLGFNPYFRGFGGEEWYIHNKYRKAGHKCVCLPWLRWNHYFGHPDGISYVLSREHKVRNYILGHQELGESLSGIHAHFVQTNKLSQAYWDWLLADPINHVPPRAVPTSIRRQGEEAKPNPGVPDQPSGPTSADRLQPPEGSTLEQVFEWCKTIPRDLEQHLNSFKAWAAKCNHVTEFTFRRESTVGLLAGKPKKFISYNLETDFLLSANGALHKAVKELNTTTKTPIEFTTVVGDSLDIDKIEETDLLFIDTYHNGLRLMEELKKHSGQVRRAMMFHDTTSYGEHGDDGGAGLNHALRLWVDEHPEWFVAFFDPQQHGLTVLSKDIVDLPSVPIVAWPPGFGPGTELKELLKSVGITNTPSCDCNAKAMQMDAWGVNGCRKNYNQIIEWMREGETKWGWKDKWSAAAMMLAKHPLLAFSLDPKDPFPTLITYCINRAEKDEHRRLANARALAKKANQQ